jgi:hypothetical protein
VTWPARLRISVLSHLPFWAAVNWDLRKALAVLAVPLAREVKVLLALQSGFEPFSLGLPRKGWASIRSWRRKA